MEQKSSRSKRADMQIVCIQGNMQTDMHMHTAAGQLQACGMQAAACMCIDRLQLLACTCTQLRDSCRHTTCGVQADTHAPEVFCIYGLQGEHLFQLCLPVIRCVGCHPVLLLLLSCCCCCQRSRCADPAVASSAEQVRVCATAAASC
jgi:hypothetical protein